MKQHTTVKNLFCGLGSWNDINDPGLTHFEITTRNSGAVEQDYGNNLKAKIEDVK